MNFEFLTYLNREWWLTYGPTLFLAVLVLVQWIVLQGLLFNYYYFRKGLKKPRPDGLRFAMIERALTLQMEQIERVFEKLAEFRKEISNISYKKESNASKESTLTSIEASLVSMGEMNLKKRIQEIKNSSSSSVN